MGMLLASDEPSAVEVNDGDGPFVIVCEHASNRIPGALGTLGLSPADLSRHIAFDIGAAEVAASLAGRLGGTLVMQRYSRLVIDCNRDPGLPDAITVLSEDTPIPGNVDLAADERQSRLAEIWAPFHAALDRLIDDRLAAKLPTALVTIHSFTPVYRGDSRPWHVGVISTDERQLAERVLVALRRDPALVVGDNQPYSAKDNVDYTIRRHGRDRSLPHVMIEIRNDIVADELGQRDWAGRLASILESVELDHVKERGVVA